MTENSVFRHQVQRIGQEGLPYQVLIECKRALVRVEDIRIEDRSTNPVESLWKFHASAQMQSVVSSQSMKAESSRWKATG